MDRWSLPGPAAFIDAVAEAIRDGANVVVAAPSNEAAALAHTLEDRLANDSWRLTGPWRPGGRLPIDEIFSALELHEGSPSSKTVASLLTRNTSKRVVIVAPIESAQWPAWTRFLSEYASASRSVDKFDRTQVLVVTAGVPADRLPPKAPALQVLAWNGQIGEGDVFSYVLQGWRRKGQRIDAQGKLVARMVTRLALWDFDLIDRLLEMSWREFFEPRTVLRAADDGREAWAGLGATWEEGGLADFDGEPVLHPLLLLRNGDPKQELSMRLWAAQAAELLPVLELKRRQLADRMRSSRALPPSLKLNDEAVRDLNDVEIGGLLHLSRVHCLPTDIVRTAEKYRDMRNKLAHLEPVTADEAVHLLSAATGR